MVGIVRKRWRREAEAEPNGASPCAELAGDGYLTARLIAASVVAHEREREASGRAMIEAVIRERQRIAREIEDGLCHRLSSIAAECSRLQRDVANLSAPDGATAGIILQQLDAAISEARSFARGLCHSEPERVRK